jgi:hypothetical protein
MKDDLELSRGTAYYPAQESQKGPLNAQSGYMTTYPPVQADYAPKATETRQDAIQKAHEENILASAALTAAVLELAGQLANFRDEFRIKGGKA